VVPVHLDTPGSSPLRVPIADHRQNLGDDLPVAGRAEGVSRAAVTRALGRY